MMFRKLLLVFYLVISIGFLSYLWMPLSDYPQIPVNSVRSSEPGDNETELRQAYYTNMDREEAVQYVKRNINNSFFSFKLPVLRLNYPPEEAGTIIRDQTKSSYLEEITLPFRESFFINGFFAKEEKDAMIVDGIRWNQKITIRHIKSPLFGRIAVGVLTIMIIPVVIFSFKKSVLERN